MQMKKILSKFRLSLIFGAIVFVIMTVTVLLIFLVIFLFHKIGIQLIEPEQFTPLLLFSVSSIAVGIVMALLFSSLPLRPIKTFIDAVDRISDGDYSVRLEPRGPDEIKNLCLSFNNMAKELDSVEMLRNDFVNNFAHEFKTPIVSIRGFAKILCRSDLSEEERSEYLNIIIDESERLACLSSSVLMLSKLEQQSILTDKTSFNLSEQIRLVIAMLEGKWNDKNIDIFFDGGEVCFFGNEEILKQIWINLIDNAIKFSPEYGTVEIKVSDSQDFIYVDVCNQGDGMSEETVAHIFDKFYQGDKSHSSAGNGLGLTIAKRIAELHGGNISVVRTDEEETDFQVLLPQKL